MVGAELGTFCMLRMCSAAKLWAPTQLLLMHVKYIVMCNKLCQGGWLKLLSVATLGVFPDSPKAIILSAMDTTVFKEYFHHIRESLNKLF